MKQSKNTVDYSNSREEGSGLQSQQVRSWGYTRQARRFSRGKHARSHSNMRHHLRSLGAAITMAVGSLMVAPEALGDEYDANRDDGHDPAEEVEYAPDHFLVTYQPWMTFDAIKTLHDQHGTRTLYTSPYGFSRVEVPPGQTPVSMAELYARSHLVRAAEPDYKVYVGGDGRATWDLLSWILHRVREERLRAHEFEERALRVAILDTGVDTEAERFSGVRWAQGWDFVHADPHPQDEHGHGSDMIGTLTEGPLPGDPDLSDTRIMPVQVLDGTGSGYTSWIADGLYYATDSGADVAHLGFAYPSTLRNPGTVMEDAVKYATYKKVVLIAPVPGADKGEGDLPFPAAYPGCIAVPSEGYDHRLELPPTDEASTGNLALEEETIRETSPSGRQWPSQELDPTLLPPIMGPY